MTNAEIDELKKQVESGKLLTSAQQLSVLDALIEARRVVENQLNFIKGTTNPYDFDASEPG